MKQTTYGLIEAGGTKFVLGIAHGPDAVVKSARIPTEAPEETIAAMLAWFAAHGALDAIGLASFGPIELDPASPEWGHILKTPKPGWSGTNLAGPLSQAFACPVGVDTDVNAAALAESRWGAGQGQRCVVYLTVGTGIGGGAVIEGQTLRGLSHPEMGHIRTPRHPEDADFAGVCPFHGDCLEGMASGPAVLARYGRSLSELPAGHPGQGIVAWYLAQAVVTVQAMLEPGRIIFGGGVMNTPGLFEQVQLEAEKLGGGYFRGKPSEVIVRPGLGERSGLLGALALAEGAL
ncbi:ROK family protein [Novosphingobium album (ex Hu et al. 2023)]|uniref:fructokinase n=1 Tax=Novosphingobium album (ex Hu et al. 2023) TaxID=2930093 RepID=A0ABT0B1F2_9SPHN|nr:ROK family protein [Novosphingobium album (ex Hu et al. 2023)]MCJ2178916.1 ROK family protein [Novosphingobium album (ex Hu et al. 2023)]